MTKHSIKTAFTALLLTVAATFVSCDRKTVFDNYQHALVTGWEKNDTLIYGPIKIEQGGDYQEQVGLRINSAFPFQKLFLVVEHVKYPGEVHSLDTLNLKVANRDGIVSGEGISYYQYDFDMDDQTYNAGDSVYIYIRHNMKREILPGVADIGVRVTRRN